MFLKPSKVNPALQVNVLSLKNNVSFPSITPFSSVSISLHRTTEKKEVNLRGASKYQVRDATNSYFQKGSTENILSKFSLWQELCFSHLSSHLYLFSRHN